MLFYRTLFAVLAAFALSTAVFADDTTTQDTTADTTQQQGTTDTQNTEDNQDLSYQQQNDQTKINLNTATAKELMKIKGLNSTKAKAIIAYRTKHGEFKSLDELRDVKGFKKMKASTMRKLQNQLTIS